MTDYEWDIIERPIIHIGRTLMFEGNEPAFRNHLKKLVCEEFNITPNDLIGRDKLRNMVCARQLYAHLSSLHIKDTSVRIGIELQRDHSTVLHLLYKINDHIAANDHTITQALKRVEEKLFFTE